MKKVDVNSSPKNANIINILTNNDTKHTAKHDINKKDKEIVKEDSLKDLNKRHSKNVGKAHPQIVVNNNNNLQKTNHVLNHNTNRSINIPHNHHNILASALNVHPEKLPKKITEKKANKVLTK